MIERSDINDGKEWSNPDTASEIIVTTRANCQHDRGAKAPAVARVAPLNVLK